MRDACFRISPRLNIRRDIRSLDDAHYLRKKVMPAARTIIYAPRVPDLSACYFIAARMASERRYQHH